MQNICIKWEKEKLNGDLQLKGKLKGDEVEGGSGKGQKLKTLLRQKLKKEGCFRR